jgi:hypothetical protein
MSTPIERGIRDATSTTSPNDFLAKLDGAKRFLADVTDFRLSLMRSGINPNFLGWIQLLGTDSSPVAYVHIGRPLQQPSLSFDETYVVLDWLPENLESLLIVLNNRKRLRIRFISTDDQAAAFLESD